MDKDYFPMAEHWAYMTPEWLQAKEREYYAKVAPKLNKKRSRKKSRKSGLPKLKVTKRPGRMYVPIQKGDRRS